MKIPSPCQNRVFHNSIGMRKRRAASSVSNISIMLRNNRTCTGQWLTSFREKSIWGKLAGFAEKVLPFFGGRDEARKSADNGTERSVKLEN